MNDPTKIMDGKITIGTTDFINVKEVKELFDELKKKVEEESIDVIREEGIVFIKRDKIIQLIKEVFIK